MVNEELQLSKKRLSDEVMKLRKKIGDIDREIDKCPNMYSLYKERYAVNLKINHLRDKIKILDNQIYDVIGYDGYVKAK